MRHPRPSLQGLTDGPGAGGIRTAMAGGYLVGFRDTAAVGGEVART